MLQKRPNINITENLISTIPDEPIKSNTVAFLSSEKGLGNKNIIVKDQVDFINKFGYPTDENYKYWYNIYEYLNYTNYINVMRVVDTTWQNAGKLIGKYVSDETTFINTDNLNSNFYNDDISFNSILNYTFSSANQFCAIVNKEITQEEDVSFSICMEDDTYDSPISTENKYVFEEIITSIPTELQSTMEINQLYLLNTTGTHTIKMLSILDELEITSITTRNISGSLYTVIRTEYNADVWALLNDGTYTEIYFRDTKNKSINNKQYTIYVDPTTDTSTYIEIILTQNLGIYDLEGNIAFYDSVECWEDYNIISSGYLKSEEKTFVLTGEEVIYDDIQYEYVFNSGNLTATRIVYDTTVQNGTTIKTFRNILNKDVDFNKNFVFLVFKKINGLFSLREVYEVAYERETGSNTLYKKNYCEDVINNNSSLVYFIKNKSTTSLDFSTNSYSILDFVLTDSTSNDYTDHDYYVDVYTSYTEATNFYRNKNNIEFKYLMGVELYNSDSSHFDMNLCPEIAEERSDVISIISIWDETDYLDSYDDMTTVLLNEFGIKNNPEYLAVNNTYTIVYDNMKLIYSEFLEKYIWVPVIGDIAGIYTLEDLKNPFNSCAGFKTNPIQNYSKMLYISFTDDDLDSLCYHSINHIERNESNDEYYLYDILMYIDEDLLTKRLNIRRTLNDFKQKLRIFLKNFMFEPNTVNNREIISTQINMIISDMISRDGVIDGYCVCDDSNNTPDIINMNELHIGIVLQPTQVIRQISIEINIEKGTIGFTENEIA